MTLSLNAHEWHELLQTTLVREVMQLPPSIRPSVRLSIRLFQLYLLNQLTLGLDL